ncbi:MAG: polyprenyl synthetase family protein [Thermosulfidibacteraceae bacterium]
MTKYKRELEELEKLLKNELHSTIMEIPEIGSYILSAGGKRLRPLLLFIISKRDGNVPEEAIHAGCAVEYIHTATLLHDDVVDESKMRRGKPTANTIWNNQLCILVGDFLFAKSFNIMTFSLPQEALKIVSRACISLAEGEILQLTKSFDIDTTIDDYYKIIYGKTAALFEASCRTGAIISKREREKLFGDFGKEIGLAFQIRDDILDLTGDPTKTGKPIGNDLKEGKLTLPVILLKERDRKYRELIKRTMLADEIAQERILEIVELCKRKGTIEEASKVVQDHLKRASTILEETEIEEETKMDILTIIEFLAKRDY